MSALGRCRRTQIHPIRLHAGRRLANLAVAAFLIVVARHSAAHDAFDAVKCDGDVARALVGSKPGDERVARLEKTHPGIGLRNEGGEEISDSLFYQAWTICGASYHLLERDGVVRDVLHADHSTRSPAYLGTCEVDGSATPYPVFAILETAAPADQKVAHAPPSDTSLMRAASAWRIDELKAQFVRMDTKGLMCPRDGISTADGGP